MYRCRVIGAAGEVNPARSRACVVDEGVCYSVSFVAAVGGQRTRQSIDKKSVTFKDLHRIHVTSGDGREEVLVCLKDNWLNYATFKYHSKTISSVLGPIISEQPQSHRSIHLASHHYSYRTPPFQSPSHLSRTCQHQCGSWWSSFRCTTWSS